MASGNLMVFTGNANPKLAADVARRLGMSLGAATVGRFSDGEVNVELLQNVRGQPTRSGSTCSGGAGPSSK